MNLKTDQRPEQRPRALTKSNHFRNDPSEIFGIPSSWTFGETSATYSKNIGWKSFFWMVWAISSKMKGGKTLFSLKNWQVQVKFGFSLKVIAIICFLMDIGWLKSCTKNLRRVISEVKIFLRGGVCPDDFMSWPGFPLWWLL